MRKRKLGSLRFEFILLPLVLLLALVFNATRLGEELENLTLDWRFQARAASDPPADPQVLVVGIDEDALAKLGRWPWSREVHAQLVAQERRREHPLRHNFMTHERLTSPKSDDFVFSYIPVSGTSLSVNFRHGSRHFA